MTEKAPLTENVFSRRFATYTLIDGQVGLYQLSLREITSMRRDSISSTPALWSGRLSTGVFGSSRCESGNKGPKGPDQVVLGIGNTGLRGLVDAGFTPCPDCKPEETPGFWNVTGDVIRQRWGLLTENAYADKTNLPFDPRRLPLEKIFAVTKKLPDRFYLPKDIEPENVQEFRERLLRLSDQIPDLGYFDPDSTDNGYFTAFTDRAKMIASMRQPTAEQIVQEKPSPYNVHAQKIIDNWQEMGKTGENTHVSIDYGRIVNTAIMHVGDEFPTPDWRFPGVYAQNNRAFAAQILTTNCINAQFNLANGETYSIPFGDGKVLSGAFAMVARMYERFGEKGFKRSILKDTFTSPLATRYFFRGINDIPYPNLRYESLRDFIGGLDGQKPTEILDEATVKDPSGATIGFRAFDNEEGRGLVDILAERFPIAYGQDVQELNGLEFPFHKRNQLTVLQLHGRGVNTGDNTLNCVDIDAVGPVADYEIPKILRGLGILQLSGALSETIQLGEEVEKDSPEEIELRAATVVAVAMLQEELNKNRVALEEPKLSMAQVDYWLWKQGLDYGGSIRAHRTNTLSY